MNRNYRIGILSAAIAVVLISIPVYLYWMYSPEAVYRRGLASAFWLSLDNDTRELSITRGETKVVPVELHHWKDLDTALYVELGSDDGNRSMDKYPDGLSVSFDVDSSIISLSKGAVMVLSKNEAARYSPPAVKQVSSDGQMVVREFGNLTVSVSEDVPLGPYYYELSTGDTKIDGGGGNSQLLTVTVVDNESEHEQGVPVTVDIGSEPKESLAQSGMDSSLMTKYLPVSITQTINLVQPTKNITIYPVSADWDGIVRPENGMESLVHDENKKSVAFSGFGHLSLHGVNATCTEPYFVKVLDTDIGENGVKLVNTTTSVPSAIYWGDTIEVSFEEAQKGSIYYTSAGYGIVPEAYNDNNDNTYRNNGAGNQVLTGTYHLSFNSFYPARINLPEKAVLTSFDEITCNVNEDSTHIKKSEFPQIFIYDVWFRLE